MKRTNYKAVVWNYAEGREVVRRVFADENGEMFIRFFDEYVKLEKVIYKNSVYPNGYVTRD